MELTLRTATISDCQLLAEMNRQLADDECSRNAMTVAALAVRMKKWLSEDWKAVLFEEQTKPVGYSVFQIGTDYYDPKIPEVYIRQFFIVRDRRNCGLGRRAFDLLVITVLPLNANLHLDVLATNPNGYRFWESLGFTPYSTAMRLIGKPHDR